MSTNWRNKKWKLFWESMTDDEKKGFENLKSKFKQLIGKRFISNNTNEEFVITKVGTRYITFYSKTNNEELASRVDEFNRVFFSSWLEIVEVNQ